MPPRPRRAANPESLSKGLLFSEHPSVMGVRVCSVFRRLSQCGMKLARVRESTERQGARFRVLLASHMFCSLFLIPLLEGLKKGPAIGPVQDPGSKP